MFPKIESSQSSMSVSKSATAKWYCLREFENDLSGRSNQVLAKEYSGRLLVYIVLDMSQRDE
jgi:hypothetical protein